MKCKKGHKVKKIVQLYKHFDFSRYSAVFGDIS